MLHCTSVLSASFALTLFLLPASAAGQSEGEGECDRTSGPCGDIVECQNEEYHTFLGPYGTNYTVPCPWHGDCLICLVGGFPASPDECHQPGCSGEEDEEYLEAYSRLARATVDAEVQNILALASVAWKHVILNENRQSLQLYDCDHQFLVANVPLSNEEMALARLLLQRPG